MNYWWVNQNQTHKHEIPGGYMWSPKAKKDGARNTFYDNMSRVNPGDFVFSFFGGKISYLGKITSNGYSSPKPDFGSAGDAWDHDGWRVDVNYGPVKNKIRPKDYIDQIRPFLPNRYSPLQQTGDGNQGVYLAHIKDDLAGKLLELIGEDVVPVVKPPSYKDFGDAPNDNPDELQQFAARVRRGQPKFRENLLKAYGDNCTISGHGPKEVLEAVHIASHAETGINELDNGLLLRCDLHSLFDAHLLRIDPGDLSISIDGSLRGTPYWELNGKSLRAKMNGTFIATKYLQQRWDGTK